MPRRSTMVVMLVAVLACAVAAVSASSAPAWATEARGSTLAYSLLTGSETPELVLAQRTIDREWGPDPGHSEVDVPGWRSEGIAMLLSATLPGSGQAYTGRGGGWWFAAIEAIGWATNLFFQREARALRVEARRLAGSPSDPASAWSFDRYERATGASADDLERLFREDPEVFMDRIGNDLRVAGGWAVDAATTRASFLDARKRSDDRLRISRVSSAGLWTNHVVAAFDAMRRARRHNEPIERALELRFRSRWDEEGPVMIAALERRF